MGGEEVDVREVTTTGVSAGVTLPRGRRTEPRPSAYVLGPRRDVQVGLARVPGHTTGEGFPLPHPVTVPVDTTLALVGVPTTGVKPGRFETVGEGSRP